MPVIFCKKGIPIPEIEIKEDTSVFDKQRLELIMEEVIQRQFSRERNTTLHTNEEGMRLFQEALQRERQNTTGRWILHEEIQRAQELVNQRTVEMIWGAGTSANPYMYTYTSPEGHITTITTDVAPSTTTSINQYSTGAANIFSLGL